MNPTYSNFFPKCSSCLNQASSYQLIQEAFNNILHSFFSIWYETLSHPQPYYVFSLEHLIFWENTKVEKTLLERNASVILETTSKSIITFTSLEDVSLKYRDSVISNRVDLKHPLLNSLITTLLLFCISEE
ncbi:hypothetical protein H5410_019977 [Solanum commersonii]|uniref:Uncharacterized protein n=1 Tax=Solanum commersonii TaxID=4109 RepID=A0A9J5Z9V2_SOLCO|nr:hypothetical protein H5410_019977 [Solanum commersonii]